MSKSDTIKLSGKVIECLPGARFKIQISHAEQPVLGYVSGKMRQHDIMILLGDNVEMEFSPYDLSKGRIVKRM